MGLPPYAFQAYALSRSAKFPNQVVLVILSYGCYSNRDTTPELFLHPPVNRQGVEPRSSELRARSFCPVKLAILNDPSLFKGDGRV